MLSMRIRTLIVGYYTIIAITETYGQPYSYRNARYTLVTIQLADYYTVARSSTTYYIATGSSTAYYTVTGSSGIAILVS